MSSCYAKILGETNFHTREFPRSGSKGKDGERERERKKERERQIVGNNNGQLRIATPPRLAHAKPPGLKCTAIMRQFTKNLFSKGLT